MTYCLTRTLRVKLKNLLETGKSIYFTRLREKRAYFMASTGHVFMRFLHNYETVSCKAMDSDADVKALFLKVNNGKICMNSFHWGAGVLKCNRTECLSGYFLSEWDPIFPIRNHYKNTVSDNLSVLDCLCLAAKGSYVWNYDDSVPCIQA